MLIWQSAALIQTASSAISISKSAKDVTLYSTCTAMDDAVPSLWPHNVVIAIQLEIPAQPAYQGIIWKGLAALLALMSIQDVCYAIANRTVTNVKTVTFQMDFNVWPVRHPFVLTVLQEELSAIPV